MRPAARVIVAGACATLLGAGRLVARPIGPEELEAIRLSKRAVAVRTATPPVIDGTLDEPAWRQADPTSDFYQQQPAEFEIARHRTEVRVLYDDRALYVGAVLYEDQPGRLVVNDLKRDFNIRDADSFGVILDTFHDRQNAYGFFVNAQGATRDTMSFDNGRKADANWNGVWLVRTRVLADGWVVELEIPFSTLRFPAEPSQQWGLNLVRVSRRDNEVSTWAPVPRQFTHYRVAYAGTLDGLEGVHGGRNLMVKPFVTGRAGGGPTDTTAGAGDAGLDVKLGMASSLVLDATVRTDFSQVEADEQQINLTRFNLFFPEKREFFLENPAAFQVGLTESENDDPRRDLVPFFSRRIGLSADGRPIPVVGGVRVSGRAGDYGIGALTMRTEPFGGRPADSFMAVNVTRDVGSGAIGGFYFAREGAREGGFNRVAGLEYRASPARNVEVEAYAMRSATERGGDGWAGRLGLRVDQSRHRARLGYVHVGEAFRHDLGFVRRTGVGTVFGSYTHVLRPAGDQPTVREYTVGVSAEAAADAAYSRVLTEIGSLRYGMLFGNRSEVNAAFNTTRDRLDVPFTVGGLSVPTGAYRYQDASFEYVGDPSRMLSVTAKAAAGGFWTGTQRGYGGGVRLRVNAHFAASTTFTRSDIRLPTGTFVGDLAGVRVDWSFSPRMFLNAFVQYNGATDSWISNVRYNFIHRPLSDIYVVWNETRLPGIHYRQLLFKYTHMVPF